MSGVVKWVTVNCEADAVEFGFGWQDCAVFLSVGNLLSSGYLCVVDEENGVGCSDLAKFPLGKVVNRKYAIF